MPWDRKRPYAPFVRDDWEHGDHNIWCGDTQLSHGPGDMDSYDYGGWLKKDDIDRLWDGETIEVNRRVELRGFHPLQETMSFVGFEQRRAAGIFWWRDKSGHLYPMFATTFSRLIAEERHDTVIGGTWTVEKRGSNYGITLVEEEEEC